MRAIKRPRENEQTAFEIKFLIKQPWIPSQPSLSPVGKEEREGLDTPREEDEKLLTKFALRRDLISACVGYVMINLSFV